MKRISFSWDRHGGIASLLAASLGCCSANAQVSNKIIDFTPEVVADIEDLNGAFFYVGSTGAGSGMYIDVLGIQHTQPNNWEEGYNTSAPAPLFPDVQTGVHTRGIWLSELVVTRVFGVDYYGFALDAHENNSAAARYVSLDQVRIYTYENETVVDGGYPARNTTDISTLGTVRYAMNDAPNYSGNYVLLDTTKYSGSGQSDLFMLVPKSMFAAVTDPTTTAVYFYTKMGTYTGDPAGRSFAAEATAEQWSNFGVPAPVPEPALSGLIAGLGLVAFGVYRFKRS